MTNRDQSLEIDELIFVVVFAGYGMAKHDSPGVVALLFGFLISYLASRRILSVPWLRRVRFFILCITIAAFSFGPPFIQIIERHQTAPQLYVHDGLIQTEESARMILIGKNPYVENFDKTPMARWDYEVRGSRSNPALYHNPYLPFSFISMAPFLALAQSLWGWFDGRLLFLPMFLGILLIVSRWTSDKPRRYGLLIFIALNPMFVDYFAQGRNDVAVLFWLVAAVELLRRRHQELSMVALGLACSIKLTAWFMLPFYALYVLRDLDLHTRRLADWLRRASGFAPLVTTVGLFVLPFFIWDRVAFLDDVWFFQNGLSNFMPYPMNGFGFAILAREVGLISPLATISPFGALQWIVGLPLLAVLLVQQWRRNTLPVMWFGYALILAVMGYFSNVLNDNHIGFILTLFAISALTTDGAASQHE